MTIKQTITNYTIEKNIPIPPKSKGVAKFPFVSMEIGDSFFVEGEKERRSLTVAASSFSKKLQRKFTVRKVEGGYRCWRVK